MAGMGEVYYLDRLIECNKKALKELILLSAQRRTDPEQEIKIRITGRAYMYYRQQLLDELGVVDRGTHYAGRQPADLVPGQERLDFDSPGKQSTSKII